MSIETWLCANCDYRAFPERLWCPLCGGSQWRSEGVDWGSVEEVTEVYRRPGKGAARPTRLASVGFDDGRTAVAKLEGGAVGATVRLDVVRAAITAVPKTTAKEK